MQSVFTKGTGRCQGEVTKFVLFNLTVRPTKDKRVSGSVAGQWADCCNAAMTCADVPVTLGGANSATASRHISKGQTEL